MYLLDYCDQFQNDNTYVLVHFVDQSGLDEAIDYDSIEPVFDNAGNLVGYLLFSENLIEFHPKESIDWFRIQEGDREETMASF